MSDALPAANGAAAVPHGGPPACLFLSFAASSRPRTDDVAAGLAGFAPLASALGATEGFLGLCAHVPSDADDPYLKDTDAPALVLQLHFADAETLRSQCAQGAVLDGWANGRAGGADGALAGRPGGAASWQAMTVERFEAGSPALLPEVHCTYLVAYDGTSPDEAAWHAHYRLNHVPLMKRLPGLRQLEVYRPLAGGFHAPALASWTPATAMQRNKVVFDSPQALTAALNSPVRHEMRRDHQQSPPFAGRSTHYPMATRSWPAVSAATTGAG